MSVMIVDRPVVAIAKEMNEFDETRLTYDWH